MKERIAALVKKYSAQIDDSSIMFSPDIPEKKLGNAIAKYAPSVPREDILILIDNTVFGSANEGALLTYDTLYVRNQLEKPKRISLSDVASVSFSEGIIESSLIVNDFKYLLINIPKKPAMRAFSIMLREIIELNKNLPASSQGGSDLMESLQKLKFLFESDLISREEYEEKRKAYLELL